MIWSISPWERPPAGLIWTPCARPVAMSRAETFTIPEPQISEDVAVVPGLDGQKMSKSYGNTIEIFGDPKATRKRFMGIVTDSKTLAHLLKYDSLLGSFPGRVEAGERELRVDGQAISVFSERDPGAIAWRSVSW